jgi:hypothetical protein
MDRASRRTKAVVATAGFLAVLVNVGVGWAYWQADGTAPASGAAGSVITLTASAVPVNDAPLYPGVTRNLRVTERNDNPFAVRVTRVQRGATAATADAGHATAGCHQTGVSITNPAYAVSWAVRGKSAAQFTLAGAIMMTDASESACQGATFRLPIVVTGVES